MGIGNNTGLLSFAIAMITAVFLSGCAASIAQINDQEAFKYEREQQQVLAGMNLSEPKSSRAVKWVQPANKKEPCKVYVGFNPDNDHTKGNGYKIFWDGECKDGYVFGLGREIEITGNILEKQEQIGIYKNGMAEQLCVHRFWQDNAAIESSGECPYGGNKPEHRVLRRIAEDPRNFDILNVVSFTSYDQLLEFGYSSFSDTVLMRKRTPAGGYVIFDNTEDEFDAVELVIEPRDKNGKAHGFAVLNGKDGNATHSEFVHGELVRRVTLPSPYLQFLDSTIKEIQTMASKAAVASENALEIKKAYLTKICKSNTRVSFMNNNEYRAICDEDAKIAKKTQQRLATIKAEKEQKRSELAQADQQQASAASQQNSNQILNQMQQLNSTLGGW
ncbi:hypothetical protein AGMMS50229_14490 [Campylobacterota bacterium]|nr:hypothetical protein AGMMS50229_14490 [Campylobacterota bacterium]